MRLVAAFARAYPGRSALGFLAVTVGALAEGVGLSALLPLLMLALGDPAASPGGGHSLARRVVQALGALGVGPSPGALLLLIVAAMVLRSALLLAANRQVGYAVAGVATDLRLRLLRALLAARWEYYVGQPLGAVANAMATEATRAASAYLYATSALALVVQALVYSAVAIMVSWQAALIAVGAGGVFFWAANRLVRVARRAGARQTALLRSLLERLADSLQSVKALKAMGREGTADSVLRAQSLGLNRALRREVVSKEALRAVQEPAITALIAAGLYLSLTRWNLPLPTLMVLAVVLSRMLSQIGRVQRQYQHMVACESAYWAVRRMIREAEEAAEPPAGGSIPRLDKAIRLEGVGFAYRDDRVLRDVSLAIPAGCLTAVIGPSGAGKTTLVDLLTGLLRPQEGEVLVDDVSLAEIDRRCWRRMIGYVPQETVLLNDTILHNVTLGDSALTEVDAERALRAAGAWPFVAASPEGIHTVVGERGGRLSGGQRQRLAIARALVHGPSLLILDEPTSALDAASEQEIRSSLQALRGHLTILAISHRTALVDAADVVYTVRDGTVAPTGALAANQSAVK